MITKVHSQKPIIDRVEPNKDVATKVVDKGKHNILGIQINESINNSKKTLTTFELDLQLEKARKEKEHVAKELEKVKMKLLQRK